MKFNEKLIELRKKQGLSQEELGYKLNVTRQTVSKWELGQTTPEMDKLIELGKIFNVSVDELVNESQIQHNPEPINESKIQTNPNPIIEEKQIGKNGGGREKALKVILIVVLVIVLALIAVKVSEGISTWYNEQKEDKAKREQQIAEREEERQQFSEGIMGIFDIVTDNVEQQINESEKENTEMDTKRFNMFIEMYSGSGKGLHVTTALDRIITSNKTEDKKITVKYNEIETQEEAEIRNIKQSIENVNDYDVILEYDEQGFINKVIIENL